jgi:tripartite motif-containing protein 71
VASRGSNTVDKLSSSGRLLVEWGRPKLRPARLDHPQSMAVDEHGRNLFVVTGSSSDHIQKFAASGRLVADWEPKTFGRLHRYVFSGLSVDRQGDVYAADSLNNHVLKLSPHGQLLHERKIAGSGDLQFGALSGAAVDNTQSVPGNMYVAYTANSLIQRFSPIGKFLLQWDSDRFGRGQLMSTAGLAVDKQGKVYVVDDANDRIEEFSSQGELQGKWGSKGSQPGQFLRPSAVAVDGKGNVYVADSGNRRIQRLAPSR